MKGAGISGLGKRFRSNPTGQGSHPGNHSAVRNAPSQPSQFGSDGFSARQSKRKAPVRTGQGHV